MHPFFRAFKSVAPAKSCSSDAAASTSGSQAAASLNPPAPAASTASPVPPPSCDPPKPLAQLPSDLNVNAPSQPILDSYPKRAFGATLRSFNPAWYRSRPWLEYSVVRDACFCFPCRKYGSINERDVVFTLTGFNNWKAALERDKGLHRHASSHNHVHASTTWTQHKSREATGGTIDSLLVGKTQLEKNHYYVKSVGSAIKFLCVNELGFRGTAETLRHDAAGDDVASGLFLKLMEYTLEKDEKLASISKGIPKNAKYSSKDIQNEMIQTLADMVLGEVRKKYQNADSAGFCLKSDGTRDRCNVENLSVMIRFISSSMPEEHLIGLLELHQLDAEYITSEILTHLSDAGYSADNILSQCYDGASVMSGIRGGVQALLQNKLARYIPYIHCYNHQLHLVVVHAIQSEPCAKRFFNLSNSLHKFFQHHYVSEKHNAPNLKRLLEIRWTSHYEVTRCIVDNQEHILSILSEMTEDDGAAVDLCTEASGLLCQIKRHHFFETGKFLVRVLGILKPANAILQSQSVDMCNASEVVGAALECLKSLREDEDWGESSQAAPGDDSQPPKRRRTMSKRLGQSVVLSTVGHTDSDDPTIPPSQSLTRSLLNILDRAISEMENRFSQKNVELMKAISSLAPKSSTFLDPTLLNPLAVLAGTLAGDLKNEILVAKMMLVKKCPNETDLSTVCKNLQEYQEAFPQLHKLYVTALVIGVSSASCESSFSTLSRVLTPYRRTMSHKRKSNLVILAHEKSITNNLDMDEFVRLFAKGNRRLVL